MNETAREASCLLVAFPEPKGIHIFWSTSCLDKTSRILYQLFVCRMSLGQMLVSVWIPYRKFRNSLIPGSTNVTSWRENINIIPTVLWLVEASIVFFIFALFCICIHLSGGKFGGRYSTGNLIGRKDKLWTKCKWNVYEKSIFAFQKNKGFRFEGKGLLLLFGFGFY